MDALEALLTRRSPGRLTDPAPDDAALKTMLDAAMRAPDHGRLRPWRFIVLRGEARARLGDLMAEAMRRREPDMPDPALEKERAKPLRAPLIVVVAASLVEGHKIPAVEQLLAAGAAAQNLQLAAHALGFGTVWRTGAPAYDPYVKQSLGLDAADAIIGFMYLGTPVVESTEGKREIKAPDQSQLVRDWPKA
ncbi:MAG TPA: NAD(P)H nitroreductase [Stellaceae bacterium]|jgi:nitroreductase|nr:NAD(P)H nitroreductase [Stellaceae bacterium]